MFSKETTRCLKGIMLIFMFILHFFCSPALWIDGGVWEGEYIRIFAKYFQKPFAICVPVFAFLTGFLYFSNREKTWRYAGKKIYSIMINYWIVYVALLSVAVIGCSYPFNIKTLFLEFLGLYRPVMYFCWYVPFYIVSMLLLTLLEHLCKKNTLLWLVFGVVTPYAGGIVLARLISIELARRLILDVSTYFPFMSIGYIVANIDIFGYVRKKLENVNDKCRIVIFSLIGFMCFFSQHVIRDVFSIVAHGVVSVILWYISIPIFVFCMVVIIEHIRFSPIKYILISIGDKSLLIWFTHCMFFGVTGDVFHSLLYAPQHPVIVLIWGLMFCYILSSGVEYVVKRVLGKRKTTLFAILKRREGYNDRE